MMMMMMIRVVVTVLMVRMVDILSGSFFLTAIDRMIMPAFLLVTGTHVTCINCVSAGGLRQQMTSRTPMTT